MATVKEIIDAFCYRVNNPAYSSYVGSTAPAQAQYYSLFEFIGDTLRNMPFNWPQLKRTYTFTTQLNVSRYQLPGDFYRILNSTQWDATNKWLLQGPLSDFAMRLRQSGALSAMPWKGYRLVGGTQYLYATSPSQRSAGYFEINPAGANATDQLSLDYISSSWVWPRDWAASTAYTAGDIRSGVNNLYRATTSATSGSTRPSHETGSATDGAVSWSVYTEPYTATNDSDLCQFDKDLMVEGMRWAYLRAKGMDYTQERADWDNSVRGALARFNGPTRINASDSANDSAGFWPNIPVGGWSIS